MAVNELAQSATSKLFGTCEKTRFAIFSFQPLGRIKEQACRDISNRSIAGGGETQWFLNARSPAVVLLRSSHIKFVAHRSISRRQWLSTKATALPRT